jgi:hypothetical protein
MNPTKYGVNTAYLLLNSSVISDSVRQNKMKVLLPFLVFVAVLASSVQAEDCVKYIGVLAKEDIFLNGRKETARKLIKTDHADAQTFVTTMNTNPENSTNYQCGNTRFVSHREELIQCIAL